MPWRLPRAPQPDAWYGLPPARVGAELDVVAGLGLDLVRFELPWALIAPERPGGASYDALLAGDPGWTGYRWRPADAIIEGCAARGLTPVATVIWTPRWARAGEGWARPPLDPGWFGDFTAAAARRYAGRVKHWEIWNEPDLLRYWDGTLAEYASGVLRAGSEAVRGSSRDNLVLLAGLYDGSRLAPLLAAGASAFDVAGLHYYPPRTLPRVRNRVEAAVTGFRRTLDACGPPAVPVWLSEVGTLRRPSAPGGGDGPVSGARGQVALLARAVEGSGADAVLWYTLRDHHVHTASGLVKRVHWGLYDADLRPAPAARRLAGYSRRPETA
jgi:hypothetical protein